MKLEDYEASSGIRGVHSSPGTSSGFDHDFWINALKEMRMDMVKVLDDGSGSMLQFAKKCRQNGIMPIVRLWRDRPNPGRLSPRALDTAKAYIDQGVTRWFEVNNEPNLKWEWQEDKWPATKKEGAAIVMSDWLADARAIIALGGYPGFPALAQSGHHPEAGSVDWYRAFFNWLRDNAYEDAKTIFESGTWLAVHDATLNHVWVEDGEYHFEYPYDPRWPKDIMEDDNSLIGHQVPQIMLWDRWGLVLPVISTEGGVFFNDGAQWDPRYDAMNESSHARWTAEMFKWLSRYKAVYPWYFGACPWLLASQMMAHPSAWDRECWYQPSGPLQVVATLKNLQDLPTQPLERYGAKIGETPPPPPPPPPPEPSDIRVIDEGGNERNWDWLQSQLLITVTRHPTTGDCYRVVELRERTGASVNDFFVQDANGNALVNQQVATWWSTAPGSCPGEWKPNCALVQTDMYGKASLVMSYGAYVEPGQPGPHAGWVHGVPSDLVEGLGMVVGTNHQHFDVVFREVPAGEAPEPPPPDPLPVIEAAVTQKMQELTIPLPEHFAYAAYLKAQGYGAQGPHGTVVVQGVKYGYQIGGNSQGEYIVAWSKIGDWGNISHFEWSP